MKFFIWVMITLSLPAAPSIVAANQTTTPPQNQAIRDELGKRVELIWKVYAQPEVNSALQGLPNGQYVIEKVVVVFVPVVSNPEKQLPFSRTFEMNLVKSTTPEGETVDVYAVRTDETSGVALAKIKGIWRIGRLTVSQGGMNWFSDLKQSAPEKTLEGFYAVFSPPEQKEGDRTTGKVFARALVGKKGKNRFTVPF